MTLPPDILGTAELAKALGIQRRTLSGYLSRGQVVPEPAWRLECGPIWTREQVEGLIASRDKKLSKTLKQLEKDWTKLVATEAEIHDPGYKARNRIQASLNKRSDVAKARDTRGTVKEQMLRHAEAELLEKLDRHAAHPLAAKVLEDQDRADRLRARRTARAEIRAGFAV